MSCPKSKHGYHDMSVENEDNRQIVERCSLCGYKLVSDKEHTATEEYANAHEADLIQPGTNEFKKVYGEEKEKEAIRILKQSETKHNFDKEIQDRKLQLQEDKQRVVDNKIRIAT
jgi:hypothetical protein